MGAEVLLGRERKPLSPRREVMSQHELLLAQHAAGEVGGISVAVISGPGGRYRSNRFSLHLQHPHVVKEPTVRYLDPDLVVAVVAGDIAKLPDFREKREALQAMLPSSVTPPEEVRSIILEARKLKAKNDNLIKKRSMRGIGSKNEMAKWYLGEKA